MLDINNNKIKIIIGYNKDEKTIKKINDLLNLPEIQKYIFDIEDVLEDLFFNEKK